ncbi:MAG: TRIC cation channel family protein [Collinsella sp.]|nr:TRIC cation channel family protein [Collinsella sp.]
MATDSLASLHSTLATIATVGSSTGQVAIPIWLEMLAVIFASISGVLAAREHRFDYLGAVGLAVACGLGGGLIRDMILQKGDVYILNQPLALPVAIATATCAFIFPAIVEKPDRLIAVLDIFAVGLYAGLGADKAMYYNLEPTVCVMMGFFTAVGGGILRDVLSGLTPAIFQSSNFYAVTAIVGALSYVGMVESLGLPKVMALSICVVITMLLRWASIRFDITTPTEVDLGHVAAPIKRMGGKAVRTVVAHEKRCSERKRPM